MTDIKSWLESRTIWSALIALAPILTAKLGFDVNATLADVLTIGGIVSAVIFRIKAKKSIS